jgi:hypothetical protein
MPDNGPIAEVERPSLLSCTTANQRTEKRIMADLETTQNLGDRISARWWEAS